MQLERHPGFALFELLIVVAVISTVAVVAIALLSSQNPTKLGVAAEEVGNALRFAVNEARRTDRHILVDAKSTAGRLKVVKSDASGANLGTVNDPLTKRALDIDTAGSALSGTVSMTPRFMQGGIAYTQLLISPATQLRAFDGPAANMGALQPGSGVVLALGGNTITVTIHESTGFVAIPQ